MHVFLYVEALIGFDTCQWFVYVYLSCILALLGHIFDVQQ
jgi:hypothetical protein